MTPLELALEWASRGVPAFPVMITSEGNGKVVKRPATAHGHHDATTEPEKLRGMFASSRANGVGLHPGPAGLVVVDIDCKGAHDGFDTAAGLDLPDTYTATTPSGGEHRWFRKPSDVHIGNLSAPGIDVRADAGWVVAPGTNTPWGTWATTSEWGDVVDLPGRCLAGFHRGSTEPNTLMAEADRIFAGIPSTKVDSAVGWWFLHADEGRHPGALATITQLLRWHERQHPGVREALDIIRTDFLRRVTLDKSRTFSEAEREWSDMVRDAAKLVASTPATSPVHTATDEDTATDTSSAHVELDALLAEQDEGYDWLIPGLLETGDRLILTGLEGRGKSTLLRQIAVQVTSGLHPFTGGPITPLTVTYVDLENSRRQVRRKVAALRGVAGDRYDGRLHFVFRPEGLNLASGVDFAWLDDQLAATQPDLCVIGPLYKCMAGDPTQEVTAMAVAARLDELRVRYNCALLVEAHSPYADGSKSKRPTRPYGASLWSRWPEFGIYLAPDGELEHWRGPRDERNWPASLRRGEPWPWMPAGEVEVEAWDGPRACMAAVAQVLTDAGAVDYSANELCRTMRTLGHRFRDRTVREAADRLALDGRVTVRTGPRNSRRYAITTVTDTLGTNDEPF